MIAELGKIVKVLGIFDEWKVYKNSHSIHMILGSNDIETENSNVVILEEWKKVKEAAARLQSNEIISEKPNPSEITDDEDYDDLFGRDGTILSRRFWLSVNSERYRQGGKEKISDSDLVSEITNDFMKVQGDDIIWQNQSIFELRLVSKSFNFEHIDIVDFDEPDPAYVKQLHRLMRVGETYNCLARIIADKRDQYNVTKNIKFIATLHHVGVEHREIMRWNIEDSYFPMDFFGHIIEHTKKVGSLNLKRLQSSSRVCCCNRSILTKIPKSN